MFQSLRSFPFSWQLKKKKKKKSGSKLKRKSVIQVNVTRNVNPSLPYKTTTKEPVAATTSQFTASKKAKLRH